jgi:NuA3 HAT complex component NTO1
VQTGDAKVKLTPEQKHIKQRATIIITKLKPMLMDAARKEAELGLKGDAGAEEDAQRVLIILQTALKGRSGSTIPSVLEPDERDGDSGSRPGSANGLRNGHSEDADGDVDMPDATNRESDGPNNIGGPTAHEEVLQSNGIKLQLDTSDTNQLHVDDADGSVPALSNSGSTNPSHGQVDPPTPPRSEKDLLAPLSNGGIPWYLEPFEPQGTTIHDEKWSGREVLRGLSEELSELDEDTMNGLVDGNMHDGVALIKGGSDTLKPIAATTVKRKAPSRKKRLR